MNDAKGSSRRSSSRLSAVEKWTTLQTHDKTFWRTAAFAVAECTWSSTGKSAFE